GAAPRGDRLVSWLLGWSFATCRVFDAQIGRADGETGRGGRNQYIGYWLVRRLSPCPRSHRALPAGASSRRDERGEVPAFPSAAFIPMARCAARATGVLCCRGR